MQYICAGNNLGNEKIESYGFSTMEDKFHGYGNKNNLMIVAGLPL